MVITGREDPFRPNDKSLYFVLRSPVKLATLDLFDAAYYLAHFGEDTFMGECHYHIVKLLEVRYELNRGDDDQSLLAT